MARRKPRVTGAKEIGRNARALKGITRANVFKGLIAGALLTSKESQKNTPRRSGNMISSAYVASPTKIPEEGGRFEGSGANKLSNNHERTVQGAQQAAKARSTGSDQTVALGNTAFYSLMVHENPRAGAPGYDPAKDRAGLRAERVHSRVGGWKFLENALKNAPKHVLRAITAAAKLPPGKVRA